MKSHIIIIHSMRCGLSAAITAAIRQAREQGIDVTVAHPEKVYTLEAPKHLPKLDDWMPRETAHERANPNQPFYRRFQKSRKHKH